MKALFTHTSQNVQDYNITRSYKYLAGIWYKLS